MAKADDIIEPILRSFRDAPEAMRALRGLPEKLKAQNVRHSGGVHELDLTDPSQVYDLAFHNMDADHAVLGRFEGPDSPGTYSNYARESGGAYFELGTEDGVDLWNGVQQANGLSNDDMFETINAPFLDDIATQRLPIRFTHDPLADTNSYLFREYQYLMKGPFQGVYRFDPTAGPAGGLVPL